jgi:hypothetical protein
LLLLLLEGRAGICWHLLPIRPLLAMSSSISGARQDFVRRRRGRYGRIIALKGIEQSHGLPVQDRRPTCLRRVAWRSHVNCCLLAMRLVH